MPKWRSAMRLGLRRRSASTARVARVEHHEIVAQAVHFQKGGHGAAYRGRGGAFPLTWRRQNSQAGAPILRNCHAHACQPDRSCCFVLASGAFAVTDPEPTIPMSGWKMCMAKSRWPGWRSRTSQVAGAAEGRSALPEELRFHPAGAGCHRPHSHGQPAATALSIISGRTPKIPRACGGAPPSPITRTPRRTGKCCWMSMRWPKRKRKTGCSRARNARPGETRCLIRLSRGGGDAVVVREYDLKAKKLARRTALPCRKPRPTPLSGRRHGAVRHRQGWRDQFRLCPHRQAVEARRRRWQRPRCCMKARSAMCWLGARHLPHQRGQCRPGDPRGELLRKRLFRCWTGGTVKKLPLPRSADVKGMFDGAWIATLREDFDERRRQACPRARWWRSATGATPQVIFAPGPRQSIESVGDRPRQDLCRHHRQCDRRGACLHAPMAKAGRDKVLPLPGQGAADIVSTNDFGPEAMFSFQNYLTPPRFISMAATTQPQADQVAAGAVRCVGPGHRAVRGHVSKDGTKIPYFVTRPKNAERPGAHRPVWLWRLRGVADAVLQRQFRAAVAEPWRHLCGGQYPRRRRVRARLA